MSRYEDLQAVLTETDRKHRRDLTMCRRSATLVAKSICEHLGVSSADNECVGFFNWEDGDCAAKTTIRDAMEWDFEEGQMVIGISAHISITMADIQSGFRFAFQPAGDSVIANYREGDELLLVPSDDNSMSFDNEEHMNQFLDWIVADLQKGIKTLYHHGPSKRRIGFHSKPDDSDAS